MEKLLKDIYGIQVENYHKMKVSLPMYLMEEKEFFEVTILGVKFIIVESKSMDRLNVSVLNKYIKV